MIDYHYYICDYDYRIIKRFERPFTGFEEVSLTLRTVNKK
jgi:hypothetical protein